MSKQRPDGVASVWSRVWLTGVMMLCALSAGAQSPNAFGALRQQLEQSRSNGAELYAPRTFARAQEALQEAEQAAAKGRKPEQVAEKRKQAETALAEVNKYILSAQSELGSVIRSRDDAVQAKASQYQPETWRVADERFKEAAQRIERDVESARRKGAEAEVLLRDVELKSIQTDILGTARQLIAEADKQEVAEFAPRSLANAKQLVVQAEQELTRSRYDVSSPRQLATQAEYEARHAMYLAGRIAQLLGKDSIKQHGLEQSMLDTEAPLRQLAGEFDLQADFSKGNEQTFGAILGKAREQRNALLDAQRSLRDRDDQIADLNTEIRALQGRLGGESEERLALQKRLSAQERLRDNVARIESSFRPEEGRAYRQSNDVIMSLTGIRFRSGKSTIEPDSFALLAKVAEAAKLFPDATLTVEGHTDNQGSDSTNLLLSQDRADAVKEYLVSNLGLSAEKVSSIGYGKSRPVANNETEAGRTRNRRIDVVLHLSGN